MIKVEGLTKRYARTIAVDNISFEVEKGQIVGFLGPNGAGKTTTLSMLTAVLGPTAGRATVDGLDVFLLPHELKQRIGLVFQESTADQDLTGRENLELAAALFGVPVRDTPKRVNELLEQLALADSADRLVKTYSGGMRRRLELAVGIVHSPHVLFLDEPTLGLDVLMRRVLLDSIRAEVQRGLTVVFTTHNLEEADYLCDRIAVIEEGRILALDTVENLKRLYSGKKTIDLTVSPTEAGRFFPALVAAFGATASIKTNGNAAVLLVEDPKAALATIVDLSQRLGVHLEWLTIRQNTLEDVFLRSISPQGGSNGGA